MELLFLLDTLDISGYFLLDLQTKDEGRVVLGRQKMGLPVKIKLSCIIASTTLCFVFEMSQKHLPTALICT